MNIRLLVTTTLITLTGMMPFQASLTAQMCPNAAIVSGVIAENWSMPYVCYDSDTGVKMKCYQSIFTTDITSKKIVGVVWTSLSENNSFTNRNLQLKDPIQEKLLNNTLCLYEIGNPAIYGNYGLDKKSRFLSLQIPGE